MGNVGTYTSPMDPMGLKHIPKQTLTKKQKEPVVSTFEQWRCFDSSGLQTHFSELIFPTEGYNTAMEHNFKQRGRTFNVNYQLGVWEEALLHYTKSIWTYFVNFKSLAMRQALLLDLHTRIFQICIVL